MMQDSLARKLRVLRASRGITLQEAEELTGVTRETLGALEHGQRGAYTATLSKIAAGYNVTVSELLEEPVPLAEAQLRAEQLGAAEGSPEGSPDPRYGGADMPEPGGRRISVKVEDSLSSGPSRVTIAYETLEEIMHQVERGVLTAEQAVEKIVAA